MGISTNKNILLFKSQFLIKFNNKRILGYNFKSKQIASIKTIKAINSEIKSNSNTDRLCDRVSK